MPNLLAPGGVLLASSLFEARLSKTAKPTDKPKFYARIGYTAEAMESPEFKAMQAAVLAAAREKWGAKADAMIKEGSVRLPFRRDIAAKGYPEHLVVYIGGSTLQPPGLVSRFKDSKTGKAKIITDKAEFYSGALVRASWAVRAYGGPGTTYGAGVSLDLRNVQKIGDGEKIARAGDASDDFGDGEAETEAGHPDAGGDNLNDLCS